jgi:hypothetical protein
MNTNLEQIAEQALQLPAASRAELADRLVLSLADADADEIQKAWAAEAVRRRDEIRSGAVTPIDGPTVIEQARRMVGR